MNDTILIKKISEFLGDCFQGMTFYDTTLIVGFNDKIIKIEQYCKKSVEEIVEEIKQKSGDKNEI